MSKVQTHANEDTRERREDPMPGDAGWHERVEALARWAPRWGGYWDKIRETKEDKEST